MDLQQLTSLINIQWIYDQLTTNQFLIAAVFAALSYSLKSIPFTIYRFIKRNISMEFTITNEDSDYETIVEFLEKKRFSLFTRTYSKKIRNAKNNPYEIPELKDGVKVDQLTLGYGTSWFFYNGCIGSVTRTFKDNNHSNNLKEDAVIHLYSRRRINLVNLLLDSDLEIRKNSFKSIKVFVPSHDYWTKASNASIRKLETVFIDQNIKQNLIRKLEDFSKNRKWFIDRGIPYKFGIFIDGKPGTGKSSLIRAIATYLEKNVYFFSNSALKDCGELLSEIDVERGILVFEDFDTFKVSHKRDDDTNVEEKDKESLSILLNTLDGSLTPDGLIFIATTNHPDKIDPALKRKGRFDFHISLNELSLETFSDMISTLYEIDRQIVYDDFKDIYVPIAGANIQDIFMCNRDYTDGKKILMDIFSG